MSPVGRAKERQPEADSSNGPLSGKPLLTMKMLKPYLIIAVVAIIAIAVVFRIPKARAVVVGA